MKNGYVSSMLDVNNIMKKKIFESNNLEFLKFNVVRNHIKANNEQLPNRNGPNPAMNVP